MKKKVDQDLAQDPIVMKNQTLTPVLAQVAALMITQTPDQVQDQAAAQTLMNRVVVQEVMKKVALTMRVAMKIKNQILLHPLTNKSSQVYEISTLT